MTTTDDRPRAWGRRTAVMGGLAAAGLIATIIPAWGHASFSAAAGFNFQPNTSGGTGAEGTTPPYPANTQVTVFARVPKETGEPDDNNVEVNILVPAGWTSPLCGTAKTNTNSAATNLTNQPGSDVPGWTCSVESIAQPKSDAVGSADGTQQLHFMGPGTDETATSAQWFTFQVTTPSPAVQTTYNGTNGTEGFIIDQFYAESAPRHWIPNAAFPGTPPQGAETTVAPGLARTVAAFDPNATTTTTSTTTSTTSTSTSTSSTSTSSTSTTIASTTTTTTPAAAANAVTAQPAFTG